MPGLPDRDERVELTTMEGDRAGGSVEAGAETLGQQQPGGGEGVCDGGVGSMSTVFHSGLKEDEKKKSGDLSSSPGYVHPNHLPRKNTDGVGVRGERVGKERKKMGSHVCYLAKVNNENIKLKDRLFGEYYDGNRWETCYILLSFNTT